jgi:hypothetical protein
MINHKKPTLLITPTLLNSWGYIFKAQDTQKAYSDFLGYLKKLPSEKNIYMLRGIEFEKECVEGRVPSISPLIKGGAFQVAGSKEIEVAGYSVLMYGKMDVIKAGVIYDIKRVSQFELNKYFDSYQHHFYFDLVPEAKRFVYLINDGERTYVEEYSRDEKINVEKVISQFIQWLKERGLFEDLLENWMAK